ncbi:polyprenyl synthetase family protein [Pontibacillus salipaludis]|uniref:Competence regulatory protein ComQ n=1 Tax=Pontibacillus salipaludis TaxID=1697394 RepID=A0ABQ1Q059_9BACI|nr:polyprenyl synthetase family protein [Pontibacillus salipaludis]GGD09077.1 competence regulatory protein ComQ [Pontibacillus salipaludis]
MNVFTDDEIGEHLLNVINKEFRDADLVELLGTFVSHKQEEGFSFGRMVHLHYALFGGQDRSVALRSVAAVEAFILALDILDDLEDQDGSEKRWTKEPIALSMNGSTALIMLATSMLQRVDSSGQAVARLSQSGMRAVTGQHHDLLESIHSEETYFRMIEHKSGSLMALACMVGTLLGKGEDDELVKAYAIEFGCAAQLANDIDDALRLDPTNDILHRKRTLPTLKLMEHEGEEADWLRHYYSGVITEDAFLERKKEVFEWASRSSAITYSMVKKRVYQLRAIEKVQDVDGQEEIKGQLIKVMQSI